MSIIDYGKKLLAESKNFEPKPVKCTIVKLTFSIVQIELTPSTL